MSDRNDYIRSAFAEVVRSNAGVLRIGCLAVVVSLGGLVGCGQLDPEVYAVHGVVKCKGSIVPTGVVMFVPVGPGQRANGTIDPDGHYELEARAGAYKVVVLAPQETSPQEVTKENWTKAFQGVSKSHVPREVSDPETSPLKYTVMASPQNQYDIDIQ